MKAAGKIAKKWCSSRLCFCSIFNQRQRKKKFKVFHSRLAQLLCSLEGKTHHLVLKMFCNFFYRSIKIKTAIFRLSMIFSLKISQIFLPSIALIFPFVHKPLYILVRSRIMHTHTCMRLAPPSEEVLSSCCQFFCWGIKYPEAVAVSQAFPQCSSFRSIAQNVSFYLQLPIVERSKKETF